MGFDGSASTESMLAATRRDSGILQRPGEKICRCEKSLSG